MAVGRHERSDTISATLFQVPLRRLGLCLLAPFAWPRRFAPDAFAINTALAAAKLILFAFATGDDFPLPPIGADFCRRKGLPLDEVFGGRFVASFSVKGPDA